jgi:hypothetical protein
VQITIDTNDLSDLDIAMLAFLAGQTDEEAEEPSVDEDAAKKAEAKEAAKAKADAKAQAAAEAEEAAADEDLVGGAPTMSDAVAAATKLVSEGEAAKVKAALAVVGAKRVSEMAETDIPAFLAALESE